MDVFSVPLRAFRSMRFRLSTIFWIVALLAVGMAAFGVWGILAWAIVVWYWAWGRTSSPTTGAWLVIALMGGAVALLLFPAVQSGAASPRNTCLNDLRQLATSLGHYAKAHGRLPAAAVKEGETGMPRSWRVEILPYLEYESLFKSYRRDESWDSANNKQVSDEVIEIYQCPSDPPADPDFPQTNYVAVVGPQTAWPEGRSLGIDEIADGADQTIRLMEVAGRNMRWAEPRDLTFDEAVEVLTGKSPGGAHMRGGNPGFLYRWRSKFGIVNVAFADGKIESIPLPLSRKLAVALLTANGGETIDPQQPPEVMVLELNYGKIATIALFALLAIAPAFRRGENAIADAASAAPPASC